MNNNRDNVFISYADKDLDQAQNIYEGLTRRGLNVWSDKIDFDHGNWKS